MTASNFFEIFFGNLNVFLIAITLTSAVLYLSVRSAALAGYLDPVHFYWTFTFGTAYGIVVGLYWLGHISDFLFYFVLFCACLFIFCFTLFNKYSSLAFRRFIVTLTVPKGDGRVEFFFILVIYLSLLAIILAFVGAGLFAETNRFEQNRGFGVFVRIADAFRLFVVAYLAINLIRRFKETGVTFRAVLSFLFLLLLIILGSAVNGSKFAMLEALYACFVASSIYWTKPRFRLFHLLVISAAALFFALLVLMMNLRSNKVDTEAESMYMGDTPVVVERLALRVLANADKYYMGLPNDVVDQIETDSVVVRFIAPLVGVTRLSDILGYEVNNFNVGRQILLYFDPDYSVAGGPTSHFDLFAYKYFGVYLAFVWVIITAFLLASINSLGRNGLSGVFYSALVATLWLRTLPILLEPPVGLAYMLDIIFLFTVIKLAGLLVPRKG